MAVAEQILNLQPLTDTRPDRALVHDAQSGDPAAASALVERYYRRIYSFVSHLTYGRANAEDLTQEVFARALKALGRFNGQYQFEHWLLRIAKNLCIDEARRSAHSPEPTDPTELSELEGIPAPDYVWESVSRDMVASVVHRALMALPPRQRTILAMREMEDMSYADIAQVVGTNPRGVEATLRRARLRFRAEVARAEAIEEGQATCRRVLRLVTDDPEAPRCDEEAASHLARCASCRRATRTAGTGGPVIRPVRAFGFLPLFGLGSLLKAHPATAPLRRAADRMREVATIAGLGTGAVALPLARMAEVTAGVVLATTVTLVPAVAALQPAATPVTLAAQAASPALPAPFVPVESVLFKASASSPVVSTAPAAATTAASASSASTAPSVVTPQAPIPSLLGPLGADPGALIATTLNNVASVTSILTAQLTQVAQLANATVAEVTSALPPALEPVVAPATKATQQLTGTLGQTLNTVTKGVQQTATQVTTPSHP